MGANSEPQITLEQVEDGTFVATCSSLPGYVARGDTEGAAIRKIRKALKLSFKEQERDFLRIIPRDPPREDFRWSRYRVPLYLRLPLSRHVKRTLSAFAAGMLAGASLVLVVVRDR
jgi:predicted RNase H-like HicB family nuclease